MKKIVIATLIILLVMLKIGSLRVQGIECNLDVSTSGLSEKDLNELIDKCSTKKGELGQKRNSLASEIQYMDTQIYLTSLRIQETEQKIISTEKEINLLGSRISGLDQSLDYISKLLLDRIVESYKQREVSLFGLLFDSENAEDLLTHIKYVKTARDNNQKLLVQVQEAKSNFEEQKKLREEKKTELDQLTTTLNAQKESLDAQKIQKQRLLAETQNDEARYQQLISQARDQLASFGNFVTSQGGATILNNQTVCDDWGCYYNQRDSQWGNNALNGTGYSLAGYGCLVTSIAMVYTHYGYRDVNPQTINSNSSNFASYEPAWLNFTVVANGKSSTRINASIDSELSNGTPVVVGVDYDGDRMPDHFLVLISGSNGNYQMNDPFTENGHNIPFTSKYSISSIVTVQRVNM